MKVRVWALAPKVRNIVLDKEFLYLITTEYGSIAEAWEIITINGGIYGSEDLFFPISTIVMVDRVEEKDES